MILRAAIILVVALWPLAAQAQTDVPVMGSSATAGTMEQQAPPALTIGDAIGGGLGAGLARVTEPSGNYDVSIRLNEESGLARPEVYDWAATVPKILDGNAFDVIVVMLGSNDRQMIRDGNMRYEFGTPEWTTTYAMQVNLLLDLQKAEVEKRGMTFLDLRKSFTNPDGSYTDSTTDGQANIVKLRGRDGISFFKAGNNLMGEQVLAVIEADDTPDEVQPAEKTSRLDVPEVSKTDSEALLGGSVPLFGQAVMDAEPYTVQPEGVTANAILLAAGDLGPEAALKTLRDIAPTGSGAESLFKLGSPEAAPAGRPDDFTAPAP